MLAAPRWTICLLLAVVLGGALTAPASPATADDLPPVETNIIGGTKATAGQFPFAAALLRRGESRTAGLACGASVLSHSWVLTAAHCLLDEDDEYPDSQYGNYVGPSKYDVLTGTTSLTGTGGQRLRVAAIYVHPSYDVADQDDDVALLRLARPTSSAAVAVIGTSSAELALDDTGAAATAAGWGLTSPPPSRTISPDLRSVGLPVQSDATCTAAYPPGKTDPFGNMTEYHASNMLCAGPMSGGKDSCSGDSGGPLLVRAPDTSWRLIGTVSFGIGCAEAGHPGVYQRLTTTSSWIARTRRLGPFNPDGSAFIAQQYRDFTGHQPSAGQLSSWRTKLAGQPGADLITALAASDTWDRNAGMNIRLYRAAFLRNPDTAGLAYWVQQRWGGRSAGWIANQFTSSSEFEGRYGALTDDGAFLTQLYQNVFHRDPDPSGRDFWLHRLGAGERRGDVLLSLSDSSEYRKSTATTVRIIATRFGLLREAPTPSVLTASAAMSQRALIDSLSASYRYASRFSG
ncbi:trypsin-like serine protease [Aquihabitans sp. McL0605]|uniref:trypsin-like serine protease n=1 Tax=Aquihabitans sp. McL0605 TaxID=3415671 RepID=UPI003CF2715D